VSFGTAAIDPGTTPSTQVAVDTIASAQYQRTKAANPNADQTGAYGVDADPVRVRPRRRGIADYDSGMLDVANGAPVLVTGTTIYPESGVLVNTTAAARLVTVHDAAGNVLAVVNVQAQDSRPLPLAVSGAWVGWKIGADGAGVRAQVAGAQ